MFSDVFLMVFFGYLAACLPARTHSVFHATSLLSAGGLLAVGCNALVFGIKLVLAIFQRPSRIYMLIYIYIYIYIYGRIAILLFGALAI